MKTKLSYLFILLYTLVSSQENSVINDLKFSNYSGHPKKITEVITFLPDNIYKSISYFDKEGFLTKIEYYNAESEPSHKRSINKVINYNSKDKAKRYFEAFNPGNKKTETTGYFEKISDSLYKRVSENPFRSISLTKLFYFDKNNRLIKTEETGNFFETPVNSTIFYTYTPKKETLLEDAVKQKKSKLIYQNVKLDQHENPVYEELTDDHGALQQKIEREFEYY
ncbi:hypothetical protein [Chryseobacterium shigense]|uniref:Uncharacterized protein n=1 Tax=Chryseobacterium shigense TaxID=297244 RepID=A0A841N101_9FLAO|nr:hypothetical protein [Chryseobacterium shigense]MBB6370514.1 hypothetical protein [Chryseobacterium shigense]